MKTTAWLLILATAGALCGCGRQPDPNVVALQARVIKLEIANLAVADKLAEISAFSRETLSANSNGVALMKLLMENQSRQVRRIDGVWDLTLEHDGLLHPTNRSSSVSGKAGALRVSPVEADDPTFTILGADVRPTEKNSSWWRMAYKIKVKSNRPIELRGHIEVQFLDAAGFVVDDDQLTGTRFPAQKTIEFAGSDLVNAAVAPRIVKVIAEVRLDR